MTIFACLHHHSKNNEQGAILQGHKLNFPIVLAAPKTQQTVNLKHDFFLNCTIQDQSEIIIQFPVCTRTQ